MFDVRFLPENGTRSSHETTQSDWFASIYGGLVVALLVFAGAQSLASLKAGIRSSQRLHDGMFEGVVGVSMALSLLRTAFSNNCLKVPNEVF